MTEKLYRDEEKLIRHIAESDPHYYGENGTLQCFFCGALYDSYRPGVEYVINHAPDCWYVWCCEWVERFDAYAKEYTRNGIDYKLISVDDEKAVYASAIVDGEQDEWHLYHGDEHEEMQRRFSDEQNTGDEPA
jgi:hypothetical protein